MVKIHDKPLSRPEVIELMHHMTNTDFLEGEPFFEMVLVPSADDDGLFCVYRNHHAHADGLSMLTVLSKCQDGGE